MLSHKPAFANDFSRRFGVASPPLWSLARSGVGGAPATYLRPVPALARAATATAMMSRPEARMAARSWVRDIEQRVRLVL